MFWLRRLMLKGPVPCTRVHSKACSHGLTKILQIPKTGNIVLGRSTYYGPHCTVGSITEDPPKRNSWERSFASECLLLLFMPTLVLFLHSLLQMWFTNNVLNPSRRELIMLLQVIGTSTVDGERIWKISRKTFAFETFWTETQISLPETRDLY